MRAYVPVQPPVLQGETSDDHYRYREYAPSSRLEPYVACYWTVDSSAAAGPPLHRIVPDGCVDIIVDLRASGSSKASFAVGLMTAFEAFRLTSDYSLFGIRFFADRARLFLNYPVSEFTGSRILLEDIWGQEAKPFIEAVQSAGEAEEATGRVEAVLLHKLQSRQPRTEPLLQAAMGYLYASKGALSVGALAEQLSYSERTVRRVFQKELGISPKELLDIIRFQCILQEMHKGISPWRLTDIAAAYGYYDQSHWIGSFKRLYGLTPSQVLK
ncbi:DUF6597 domain-containing transcriptional factor [Paenibacillus hodogayensis]|uniref:DUF6597 domain-containing transcriptional factor n=1 Tax=Paenibacillus hodogayensis TaxID=279208 RepID=A0ABV5VWJ4_9BACL